jgi:hypothetical protein
MANLNLIIAALQPHDATTEHLKMEMLKGMIMGMPMEQRALEHYLHANSKFTKQTIQGAIQFMSRELKNTANLTDHSAQVNSVLHEELMVINSQLLQNQAAQESEINQLRSAMSEISRTSVTPTGSRQTMKYCHLHGSNNTHNGTVCKKMGSPGFTMCPLIAAHVTGQLHCTRQPRPYSKKT